MLQLHELTTIFTKLGFIVTFLINCIFINLTASYTKLIPKTYKRMLVIFAITCVVFSIIELTAVPYSQNYNAGLVYFSLSQSKWFSQSFLQGMLYLNASCYVAQLVFIAIQFLFRYFTLIQHPIHKSFKGRKQVIWIFYFFAMGIIYGLSVYHLLQPDAYSDAYLREEVLRIFRRDIKDLPRAVGVAYENGKMRFGVVTFFCIGSLIIGAQYLIIIFCSLSMQNFMKTQLDKMSTRNRRLEEQFFKALTIQIILPTFLITLPIGFVILVPLMDIQVSFQTGTIFALYSLYPPLDSIATMVIVKEYRSCWRRFWRDLMRPISSSKPEHDVDSNNVQLNSITSTVTTSF